MQVSDNLDNLSVPAMALPHGFIESLLLGTVHMWHSRHNKKEVVELVLQHFVAEDVFKAMVDLAQCAGGAEPKKHNNSAARSAGEAYAPEVYDMLDNLSKSGKLPKIVVPSLLLGQVPLTTIKSGDDTTVSVRLDSLDNSVKQLTDILKKVSLDKAVPVREQSFGAARARAKVT